jgi:hypothetical protein
MAEGPHEELEAESATRGQVEIAYEGRSFQSAEDGDRHIHRTLYVVNAFSCSPRKRADPDVSNFPGERLPDFPVSWMMKLFGDLTPRRPELFNDKRQLKSYLAVSNPGLSTWAKTELDSRRSCGVYRCHRFVD